MSWRLITLSWIFCFGLISAAWAEAEQVTLATGEWAPFTSESIFGGGSTTLILKKAFESQSVKFDVKFMSWTDAVKEAETSPKVHGWYPAYFSEARSQVCAWSEIIGTSLVGFAHLSSTNFKWSSLQELSQHKIGVVAGYVNEREFDASVARGEQNVVVSNTDVENLMNLVTKRVDAAVIDRRVMVNILRKNADLKSYRSQVKFDLRALKEHPLYVCFTGVGAKKWASTLNAGLKATSVSKYEGEDPFMKRLKKKP